MKRLHVEIDVNKLDQLVEKACEKPLSREEGNLLKTAIHAIAQWLDPTGRPSEKKKVLERRDNDNESKEAPSRSTPEKEREPRPGHGRNGVGDYPGATFVNVHHPELKHRTAVQAA